MANNAERALNLLFDRCAADALCNNAYPELKTIFYETVERLDSKPITLHLTHPTTGLDYTLVMNGDRFIGDIFTLLYFTDALPNLPRLISDLHEGRSDNMDSQMKQFLSRSVFQGDYFSEGMYTSVQCYDDLSFSSPESVTTANATVSPRLRDTFPALQGPFFEICSIWGSEQAPGIENQPVVSDIPTLILAGDNDPITPPAWGQLAAETLRNSHYFEFRGVGHGVWGAGLWGSCSRNMVSAFLADPLSMPDSTCLDDLKIFFVTE